MELFAEPQQRLYVNLEVKAVGHYAIWQSLATCCAVLRCVVWERRLAF